jgi:hypothetical protein
MKNAYKSMKDYMAYTWRLHPTPRRWLLNVSTWVCYMKLKQLPVAEDSLSKAHKILTTISLI